MCLVKVRQEEDVVVPYRVASPRRTSRHYSRTQIVEEERRRSAPPPRASYHSTHVTTVVPSPRSAHIPAPQPVPIFVNQPPTPPPPPPASSVGRHSAQYVHVSPASSVTSHSRTHSDYYVSEHEYRVERERRREREQSRDRSRRRSRSRSHSSDGYYERPATYRYVDNRPQYDDRAEFTRSRSTRSRSRSRGAYDDHQDGRVTSYGREKVVIVNDDGRRRREYLP